MPTVVEDVPNELRGAADAAVAWINAERGADFHLTGLVDPEEVLAADRTGPFELGVVLCEGEVCLREQVRLVPRADGFDVSAIDATAGEIPAELDPPRGVRQGWLDARLADHRFVVLLFYRGFW